MTSGLIRASLQQIVAAMHRSMISLGRNVLGDVNAAGACRLLNRISIPELSCW